MEIRELRSLASLAETGSLAVTAQRLHLSPAAIHRQLRILGEETGLAPYERTGRELSLTQSARDLLPLVQELLAQFDSLRTAAIELRGTERGSIRIGSGPTFSNYLLPRLLERFRAAHPAIEIMVDSGHSSQLTEKLRNGQLDVAFLVSSGTPEFAAECGWRFDIVLVASPTLNVSRIRTIRDLRPYPFVLYKQGTVFEEIIERHLDRHGFQPKVTMRLDNAEPIKAMLLAGFGVSLLPLWTVEEEIRAGRLVRIACRQARLSAQLEMIRRRSAYVTPAVRAFTTMAANWRIHSKS
jgi:DNA-binding transcriptional LysR family regulator